MKSNAPPRAVLLLLQVVLMLAYVGSLSFSPNVVSILLAFACLAQLFGLAIGLQFRARWTVAFSFMPVLLGIPYFVWVAIGHGDVPIIFWLLSLLYLLANFSTFILLLRAVRGGLFKSRIYIWHSLLGGVLGTFAVASGALFLVLPVYLAMRPQGGTVPEGPPEARREWVRRKRGLSLQFDFKEGRCRKAPAILRDVGEILTIAPIGDYRVTPVFDGSPQVSIGLEVRGTTGSGELFGDTWTAAGRTMKIDSDGESLVSISDALAGLAPVFGQLETSQAPEEVVTIFSSKIVPLHLPLRHANTEFTQLRVSTERFAQSLVKLGRGSEALPYYHQLITAALTPLLYRPGPANTENLSVEQRLPIALRALGYATITRELGPPDRTVKEDEKNIFYVLWSLQHRSPYHKLPAPRTGQQQAWIEAVMGAFYEKAETDAKHTESGEIVETSPLSGELKLDDNGFLHASIQIELRGKTKEGRLSIELAEDPNSAKPIDPLQFPYREIAESMVTLKSEFHPGFGKPSAFPRKHARDYEPRMEGPWPGGVRPRGPGRPEGPRREQFLPGAEKTDPKRDSRGF